MYGVFVAVGSDSVMVTRGVIVMVVNAEVDSEAGGVTASPSVLLLTLPLGMKGG